MSNRETDHPPSPRAVVFDLDGTLIDSLADLTEATNRTLEFFGLPRSTSEDVRTRIGSGARALVQRSIGERIPLDTALERFNVVYKDNLVVHTVPFPGMVEILDDLGALGVVRGVATNKPAAFTGPILERLGLTSRVDGWASGDECVRKPDPATIRLALTRAGLRDAAVSTVYVGDMAVDVRTARRFGARCIGVTWGLDPKGLAEAGPDELVDSVEDLREALGLIEAGIERR